MSEPVTAELLGIARRAASAGARVLSYRDPAEFSATMKDSDADWVSTFDVAAERLVRETIHSARPADAITGEELAPALADAPSGYRWSIDPLDGTMNFLRNIVYYATSVAVFDPEGQPVAGVVAAPALDRTYYASRGEGAWLISGHRDPERLHGPQKNRPGNVLATSLTYDKGIQQRLITELSRRIAPFGDFRRLGSAALELCAVAEGGIDAYLEYGLFEHDFAAGALIAAEAGAFVRTPSLPDPLHGLPSRAEVLTEWTLAASPELVSAIIPADA